MGLLRWILRAIGRAIASYNPAPLDRPTDYELGRGTLYIRNERTGELEKVGHCTSFRLSLRTESKDSKP